MIAEMSSGDSIRESLASLSERQAVNTEKLDDIESRLRSLEQWKWIMIGGCGVVSSIATLLINLVFSIVSKHL